MSMNQSQYNPSQYNPTSTYRISPEQLDLFPNRADPVLGGEYGGALESAMFDLLALPVTDFSLRSEHSIWEATGAIRDDSHQLVLTVRAFGKTMLEAVRELLSISQLYVASKSIQKQQALSAKTGSSP